MPFGFGRRTGKQADDRRRVGTGLAADLLTRGGASAEEIATSERRLGTKLPPSLVAFIEQADGAEGWIAGDYLAVWPVALIDDLNNRARIADCAPELVAFASDGQGEGYFFHRGTGEFVTSPLIGLGRLESAPVGSTFDDMLVWIASSTPASDPRPAPDPSRFGLVIHEIKPVLFGGDPVDPANKAWVSLADYASLVAWWNNMLRESEEPALRPADG